MIENEKGNKASKLLELIKENRSFGVPKASRLLELIREKPRDRNELVKLTGMTRTTIYDRLRPYIISGIVKTYPLWSPEKKRGKPRTMFTIEDKIEKGRNDIVMSLLDDRKSMTIQQLCDATGFKKVCIWRIVRYLKTANLVKCEFYPKKEKPGGVYSIISKRKKEETNES